MEATFSFPLAVYLGGILQKQKKKKKELVIYYAQTNAMSIEGKIIAWTIKSPKLISKYIYAMLVLNEIKLGTKRGIKWSNDAMLDEMCKDVGLLSQINK